MLMRLLLLLLPVVRTSSFLNFSNGRSASAARGNDRAAIPPNSPLTNRKRDSGIPPCCICGLLYERERGSGGLFTVRCGGFALLCCVWIMFLVGASNRSQKGKRMVHRDSPSSRTKAHSRVAPKRAACCEPRYCCDMKQKDTKQSRSEHRHISLCRKEELQSSFLYQLACSVFEDSRMYLVPAADVRREEQRSNRAKTAKPFWGDSLNKELSLPHLFFKSVLAVPPARRRDGGRRDEANGER